MTTPRSQTHANPYAVGPNVHGNETGYGTGPDIAHYSDAGTPLGPGNNFWYNGEGWAPKITRDDYQGVTDPTRVEELPRHDRRANLRNPWAWWANYDADTARRHSVEVIDANGFTEQKGQRSRGPHPLWSPPPEPRPTNELSPHSYYFERPYDQEVARRFNGAHLSLADNRRNYEILIQSPVPRRRNTHRLDPSPWDTDILDESPPVNAARPNERLNASPIPPGVGSRTYRLD